MDDSHDGIKRIDHYTFRPLSFNVGEVFDNGITCDKCIRCRAGTYKKYNKLA